jgi:hypothetical protein
MNEELLARLAKVEAQYRRLRAVAVIAAISLSSLMLMGQTPLREVQLDLLTPDRSLPSPSAIEDVIRTRQIILYDTSGVERATMVTDGAGSVFIQLKDRNGRLRSDLQLNNFGPSLTFYEPNGQARMILGSTLLLPSRVVSAEGQVERQPPSSIGLFDRTGKVLWRAP